MHEDSLKKLSEILVKKLILSKRTVAIGESCTGGLLSSLITEVPGSSKVFPGAIICYSNESKIKELNISSKLIEEHGAVSKAVCEDIAKAAIKKFSSFYGVGISGIAGPAGGSPEKPVGTVFIAIANNKDGVFISQKLNLSGSRGEIRQLTALKILRALLNAINS